MKCVLTAAGLGTRLLPLTKELPKEMLPIYDKSVKGNLIMKPILQVIFESLYENNIRDFCIVTGKTKRAIKDHFSIDTKLEKYLKINKKYELANETKNFNSKLNKSKLVFSYQSKPIGFGNAIEKSKKFVGNDIFLLHAGDDIVISKNNSHLKRLEKYFSKYNAEIAMLIEKVEDPSRYGVVDGPKLENNVIDIKKMVEKPKNPPSKNAIIAIYLFKPSIFKYLHKARKTSHPEKQLAEAFNIALREGKRIIGINLKNSEKRVDIGTAESYKNVLNSLG